MDLTGLLCDCGGLALAILRDRGHADVVADAGLQSVNGVLTGRRQNHVLKDGYALAGCHHRDPVTSDGCGVERWPAEADGGVAHALEAEVRQLWDVWVERIGRGMGCRGEMEGSENTKQTRRRGGKTEKPVDKNTEVVVRVSNRNCQLPVGRDVQHTTPMEEQMQGFLSWYISPSSEVSSSIQWGVSIESS